MNRGIVSVVINLDHDQRLNPIDKEREFEGAVKSVPEPTKSQSRELIRFTFRVRFYLCASKLLQLVSIRRARGKAYGNHHHYRSSCWQASL